MKPWQRKAVVSNVKALIPFRNELRSLYRRIRPYETDLPTNEMLFSDALKLVQLARQSAGELSCGTVLELGTGWVPVTTLMFSLLRPVRIVLTDQERLLDARTFDGASTLLRRRSAEIAEALGVPAGDIEAALHPAHAGASLADRLKARRMEYHVPFDFAEADPEFDFLHCSVGPAASLV